MLLPKLREEVLKPISNSFVADSFCTPLATPAAFPAKLPWLNLAMDRQIMQVGAVCDYVQGRMHSGKKLWLSFDEWNSPPAPTPSSNFAI